VEGDVSFTEPRVPLWVSDQTLVDDLSFIVELNQKRISGANTGVDHKVVVWLHCCATSTGMANPPMTSPGVSYYANDLYIKSQDSTFEAVEENLRTAKSTDKTLHQ